MYVYIYIHIYIYTDTQWYMYIQYILRIIILKNSGVNSVALVGLWWNRLGQYRATFWASSRSRLVDSVDESTSRQAQVNSRIDVGRLAMSCSLGLQPIFIPEKPKPRTWDVGWCGHAETGKGTGREPVITCWSKMNKGSFLPFMHWCTAIQSALSPHLDRSRNGFSNCFHLQVVVLNQGSTRS